MIECEQPAGQRQRMRALSPAVSLLLVPLVLPVAACGFGVESNTTALYGAETARTDDVPRPVPARATGRPDGTVFLEVAASDGAVFRGPLAYQALPVVASQVSRQPVAGGGRDLAGTLASETGESLECRLALMNPGRGVNGGGVGACSGSSRRVDFRF